MAGLGLCAAAAADNKGQSAKDWPTFRGNPAQSGVAGSSLPRRLDLLWTYEAGSAVGSTAAIVKGTVYVGNDDGNLLADFPLNQPEAADCAVLVAGNNFGCGSSREHAPWGLVDFGFRAVISTQFADIFINNSLKNGLLPIIVDAESHKWLLDHPGAEVEIDVAAATLTLPNGQRIEFPLDSFSQHCLLEGIDQLGFLRSKETDINTFEQARAWKP